MPPVRRPTDAVGADGVLLDDGVAIPRRVVDEQTGVVLRVHCDREEPCSPWLRTISLMSRIGAPIGAAGSKSKIIPPLVASSEAASLRGIDLDGELDPRHLLVDETLELGQCRRRGRATVLVVVTDAVVDGVAAGVVDGAGGTVRDRRRRGNVLGGGARRQEEDNDQE